MGRNLELAIGALNGVIGDYLERTSNGLGTPMCLVRDGAPIEPSREALAALHPAPPRRLAVLVHGLMSTEDVFRMPGGETYGTLLARDLGFAALDVRYNSGRRISDSGASLDALLSRLVEAWPGPIDDIALIGHSMGGLVIRAATHTASSHAGDDQPERASPWLPLAKRAFYLGSPHLGAPLERFGNVVTWALGKVGHPVATLVADILNLRSAGVKDLRYGNLRREDWEGLDADALLQNSRHPAPLLPHIHHHLVVGSLSRDIESTILLGDVLVPVRSAAGRAVADDRCAPFPQEHVRILPGYHHLRLAHDPAVYNLLRAWCEEGEAPSRPDPERPR